MVSELEPAVTLPWLVRLRWLFVAGLLLAPLVARWVLGSELGWLPLVVAAAVGAISNLAITHATRRGRPPAHVMGVALIIDTALLTWVLAASGGAMNPFTVFYLVYITLSAVVLSAGWTTVIGALAVLGFGLLFLIPVDPHVMHHGTANMSHHLQGMWVAFVLAAILTAFFTRRITRAIGAQRDEIASLRVRAASHARLAALTTLAAGAAHELNSPLGTIAVAAHDARLRLRDGVAAAAAATAEDLELIQLEVERCQDILHQLSARASDASDAEEVDAGELVARVRAHLGDERAARLAVRVGAEPIVLELPAVQLVQSVAALLKNALDASPPERPVELAIERVGATARIAIQDHGAGMPADVLAKVGEPFFTTKAQGDGMGLGVFLARLFFESLGGGLAIESEAGRGTRALATLPLAGAAP